MDYYYDGFGMEWKGTDKQQLFVLQVRMQQWQKRVTSSITFYQLETTKIVVWLRKTACLFF